MPDTYTVHRSIRIDAPARAIFERLVDFRRWSAWSPFEDLDPGMDRTYSGAASGVGAVYEWSGNLKAGSGRMEIAEAVPGERVVVEQRNAKPFRSTSTSTFTLTGSGSGASTELTWSTRGSMTLLTHAMGIFSSMDRVIGPLFEKGLARLKADAEAAA